MARKMLTVRLDEGDHDGITASAAARGATRSEWVRRLIRAQVQSDLAAGRIPPTPNQKDHP